MAITAVEKLMYQVMKAIFDSGIPVSFKGSMVLKACLLEAGYDEETRHTVDIDDTQVVKGSFILSQNWVSPLMKSSRFTWIIPFRCCSR